MRRFLRLRAASAVSSTYSTEGGRTIGSFHIRNAHKRRGDILPARLRFSAHRGVTLIELMISMLILALVCVAWLEIIGIQSAKKEARRREAVERLAGMMDAFLYNQKGAEVSSDLCGFYRMEKTTGSTGFEQFHFPRFSNSSVHPVFESDISPIGYQLEVVDSFVAELKYFKGWGEWEAWDNSIWLIGRLYNRNGSVTDAGKPFFTLPVCLGLGLY